MRFHSLPVILQGEHSECGLACIAMISGFHGHAIDIALLRARAGASPRGTSLRDLIRIGALIGLESRVVKVEPETIDRLKLPAILHWDMSHFVVLKRVSRRRVEIHDPNHGAVYLGKEELGRHLSGIAIELRPGEAFTKKNEFRRITISDLTANTFGILPKLTPILLIAAVAQLLAIIAPYYFQIAIDRVVPYSDFSVLGWMTLLFLGLAVVDWLVRYARNAAALQLGFLLNVHMSERLLSRLLRMPLSYFESRSVSGVVAKFESLEEIRSVICEDAVMVLVEGLMCTAMIILLFMYSPGMALIAISSVAAYTIYQTLSFKRFRLLLAQHIVRNAQQRDHLLQSVRNAIVMKAGSAERQRESEWKGLFSRATQDDLAIRRARSAFQTAREGFLAFDTILIGFLALGQVMAGSMTIGMVIAFLTYKRLFSGSAMGLVEVSFKVHAVRVHLDNLIDLMAAAEEAPATENQSSAVSLDFDAPLHVDDISFQYPGAPKAIIDGFSAVIQSGERVAIRGGSGVGKTTLLKILLGLIEPESGGVRLGQNPITLENRRAWLSRIGVVLQGEALFSGSVRENIAFGAEVVDDARIAYAANLACIDHEIEAMPMGYETHLGDRGGTLSGGQAQRVLIARALYRRPSMLIMDEGTANLDLATESQILANIASLGITVIHAAHRQQVIDDALKVISLEGRDEERVVAEEVP